MISKMNQTGGRWGVEIRKPMNRMSCIRGYRISMSAFHILRAYQLRISTIKGNPIKISLRRVIRRSQIVKPAVLFINTLNMSDIKIAFGDLRYFIPTTRNQISMAPAIAFTQPNKILVLVYPKKLVIVFDPGLIGLDQNIFALASLGVCNHHRVFVLQSIKLLQHNAGIHPIHLCKVMIAGITRNLQESCFATLGADNANLRCRIFLTGFWVTKSNQLRIRAIRTACDKKIFNALGINLPIRNRITIRAPTKAFSQPQFFFINPIESAID